MILRLIWPTDHRRVSSNYLVVAGCTLLALAGRQVIQRADSPSTDLALWLTLAGVLPSLVGGFGYRLTPVMLGTPRTAFPAAGPIGFWLLAVSLGLAACHASHAGLLCAGASALVLVLDQLITIIAMRAPGVTLNRAPLFVWAQLVACILVLLFLPVLAGAATVLGAPSWPVLHPLAYILMLPALGIIGEVLQRSLHEPLAARMRLSYGLLIVGLIGAAGWLHFLLTPQSVFGPTAMEWLVTGCAGVLIVLSAPMMRHWQRLDAARLWAFGALFLFASGIAADALLLRSHMPGAFGHFHNVLSLGAVFAGFAGLYRWSGQLLGLRVPEAWGRAQFAAAFVGVNLNLLPAHVARMAEWHELHVVGAALFALSLLLFLGGILSSRRAAESEPADGFVARYRNV